ncbi:MAG: hypothetical protein K940chlam3_01014 [Chlamydiae bacterium]|nr:hypothetical protein [Chlamydiota bacterium]
MDFFQHQEKAKKNTFRLIMLFFCAVVGIVVVVYILVAWLNAFAMKGNEFQQQDLWNPVLFVGVTFFTLLVIGLGTLYKSMQLKSGGGSYVAESLGGRLIEPGSNDPNKQKILHVVEEMAIAAGIPAPSVYLLDQEEGINAFAAGYSPGDAIIGVTRGCIEQLNRDELQGVIAHEFSHILNGDMRLNIRLIGLLFGILALGLIGYYTMRSAVFARGGSRQQSRGTLAILALGIGLTAIGFVGTFFGHLIKAAVSRQREFLADASAVQFTRNPEGVGNALKKIRDYAFGSKVASPHAAEVSHMFFSKGILSGMAGMFATHPPIEERIRRVLSLEKGEVKKGPPPKPAVTAAPAGASLMATMGRPNVEQIQYAKTLVGNLPGSIKGAIRDSFGARAVIYGLLLSKEPEIRKMQLDALAGQSYMGVYRELNRMLQDIEQIEVTTRIPLIDMSMPAFKMLSKNEYRVFRENIKWLIHADKKIDLFEWVLEKVLVQHLDDRFSGAKKRHGTEQIKDHMRSCRFLLETLSHVGHKDSQNYEKALEKSLKHIEIPAESLKPLKGMKHSQLNQAIDDVALLAPQEKKKILEACLVCMEYDKVITVYEAELFRAIGDAIGCPVPLILPSK